MIVECETPVDNEYWIYDEDCSNHLSDVPNEAIEQSTTHEQCRPTPSRPYLGILLAILSSLFFSLCSVIVKGLVEINPMELAAFRFIGVLLPTIPIIIWKGEHPFPKGRRIMLIMRSFVGTTGLMLSFYAFRHMPLADASVIVFSVPVFVAIFARIFLNEPCGPFNVLTVCLTLIGVTMITRPAFLFGINQDLTNQDNYKLINKYEYTTMITKLVNPTIIIDQTTTLQQQRSDIWGPVAALSATLFGANAYVLLRALKGLHFSVIMLNFGSFALIQTFLVSWAIGALCLPRSTTERLLVVALGLFSFGGQILLTMALQIEQAGPIAIARSADIVFAFFWQVLFFNEVPNRYSITGALLVTSSVIFTGLRKWFVTLPDNYSFKKSFRLFSL